ncbi:zinc ABC transporter ATP-binding protein AztA [Clavibacter michiganensis]|uniref:zinc ABC transporter ATP-binding protein AztA n=2 Tax=Clavibacter michiganensis TaxID=28447 RepID=UPI000A375579|nr:zinc ABC transporter ATP-binding protein AztA [Clavibacter michiganensis]MDO4019394.1 zinc ABC transporter ATP-binding protein AztA [Clavibacter michiganensis]MDO4038843.1 zinc ABC transporter ATP-binding protein AztA [Clavibacter michiganensis]MDO4041619.1 zinc ABC transporter ATP-binding protein AztA [Clavibacter michiganensis]MDO4045273.1 zinc ABC transporter ATP-binding protein AztA [Clavibacter michiganensis]MDO4051385.1 zinc ABC transporter ATP-binding protein AztA [Clavibacter michig
MPSSRPTAPAAVLRGIRVELGTHPALAGVDLDFMPGALTVIAGPNGAGKSTLLEVVAGTRPPTSGTRTAADPAAFVPQRTAVSDRLPVTVRDVVTVGAWGRVHRWRRLDPDARRAVDDALDRLGLMPLASQGFAALSGGQRQRALLAQGLARGAGLLLLDEPTTGLDTASAKRIRAIMRSEASRGVAVVCVSHDRAVIDDADRVVRLEDGLVVADAVR